MGRERLWLAHFGRLHQVFKALADPTRREITTRTGSPAASYSLVLYKRLERRGEV